MSKNLLFLLCLSGLILISCQSNSSGITRVLFKAKACYGRCPIFTMKIKKSGETFFNAMRYNERQGKFKRTLPPSQLDSLKSLIHRADVLHLRDHYTTGITDLPTYVLRVYFKNKPPKIITDYGPSGPQSLQKVYDFIFSLRKSEEWKPVSTE